MTAEEAMNDALMNHLDCAYADWETGLNVFLQLTYVVSLWRNEECHAAGDPPRHIIEGYVQREPLEVGA